MRVRMTMHITGLRNGQEWPAIGGEIVVPDAEGVELCASGCAEPVAEVQRPETRARRVKSSE